MDKLIPIDYANPERPTVSGRELHKFLNIETPYAKWFGRMVEYGFTEGEDFVTLVGQKCPTNNPKNPVTERTDHQLTIPMAKELCMLQRNERGKQARKYFIAVEEQWNSPEAVMRRAVLIADKKVKRLQSANQMLLAENMELKAKKGIEVTYCLNGHIQIDDYVKVESREYKGNYRASKIRFTGDTEGDDWQCVGQFVEVK